MLVEIVSGILIVTGVMFCGLGIAGMLRFPTVYTRLHAGGLVSTVGIAGVLLGAMLVMPSAALKLLILGTFVFFGAPAATHAIARAAHREEQGLGRPVAVREMHKG